MLFSLDSFSDETMAANFSISKFPFLSQNRATAIVGAEARELIKADRASLCTL